MDIMPADPDPRDELARLRRIEKAAADVEALLFHNARGERPGIMLEVTTPELAATLRERLQALHDALPQVAVG